MKTKTLKTILLILMIGFTFNISNAASCANFNLMTAPIADYNNDSIYPIGSVLLNSGDIKIVKTKTGSWSGPGYFEQTTLNSVSSSQIFFHGYLTFDVSSTSYSCRELSIEGTAEKIIIGNDTISTLPGFNPYNGNGFVIDTLAGGGYFISGNFNAVTIWIPTGLLNSLCVSSCANSSSCIDYRNLIGTSWPVNTGYNNDSLYPAGSTILSTGGVKIIKTYTTGNWNPPYNTQFAGSTDTTLLLSGNVTLDVSSSTYSCKKLTFSTMWGPTVLVIDGDTIPNPSTSYSGSNYNMTVVNSSYTVTGSFNTIILYSPNLGLGDICLEDCSVASSACLDFRNLIGTSWPGGTGYNNDSLYPAGSTILSAGDVKLVKTHPYGNWNPPLVTFFAFGNDSSITGDGYMTIDVASSTYSCKQLSFSTIASTLIINGDTITNFGANSNYSGSVYNIVVTNMNVVVTGSFNTVILGGSNLTIINVCLGDCSNSSGCFDFNSTTLTNAPTNYNNDSIYPIGSPFVTIGDLKVIKTKTGAWTAGFQQSTINQINANDILYHGFITFDVSSASYLCRELTIIGYASQIIIGNDTIATTTGFAPYNGTGFVIDTVSGGYKITGTFNSTTLFAQTSIYSSVCLDSCTINNTGCLDFRDLIGTSWPGNTGYNNDLLYPAGSTILSAGDVKIVKTHPYGNWNPPLVTSFAFGTDTTITGDGYMTIDVSSSTYPCKQLNFSTIASTLIINGDTITNFGANNSYSGSAYNIAVSSSFYKDVVVTGSFNTVILGGSNLTIGNVCMDSCVTPPCNSFASFTFTITPNGVLFTNTSSVNAASANQFQWDFGDGNYSGNNDPTHTYTNPGTYWVCLTIVDFSCPTNPTMQYCDSVTVGGCNGGHKIITPNGDGQADEVFIPAGSKIYDRNGFLVKSIKQDMNWKGDDDSNRPLPMGYYTIICGSGDGVFNVTIVK